MPSHARSLMKSARRGDRRANLRSVRVAAPKRAIAVIGAKLGGCGASRVRAARSTAPRGTAVRGRMAISLLVDGVILVRRGRAQVGDNRFILEVEGVLRPAEGVGRV